MTKLLFLFVCCCFPILAFTQDYKYLPIPEKYNKRKVTDLNQLKNKAAFQLTVDFLPENYVRNGTVDYTEYLQACLDSGHHIIMPDFPVLINDKGVAVRTNTVLFFQKNSKLLLKPSDKGHYVMLKVFDVKDVTILNANLVGDKQFHRGESGEWGHGISIRGAENIKIKGAKIRNCWGDGIYIARRSDRFSKNIKIENSVLDNNRRNNLSIISAKDLMVKNCVFANASGTNPMAGIDIEPNNPKGELHHIVLKNNISFNNEHLGLELYLKFMPSTEKEQKVTILIDDFLDDHSERPLLIAGSYKGDREKTIPLKGKITIKDFRYKNNSKQVILHRNRFLPVIILKGEFH